MTLALSLNSACVREGCGAGDDDVESPRCSNCGDVYGACAAASSAAYSGYRIGVRVAELAVRGVDAEAASRDEKFAASDDGDGERGLSGTGSSVGRERGVGRRLTNSGASFADDSMFGSPSAMTSGGDELRDVRVSSNSKTPNRFRGPATVSSGDSTRTGLSALEPVAADRFGSPSSSGDDGCRLGARRPDFETVAGSVGASADGVASGCVEGSGAPNCGDGAKGVVSIGGGGPEGGAPGGSGGVDGGAPIGGGRADGGTAVGGCGADGDAPVSGGRASGGAPGRRCGAVGASLDDGAARTSSEGGANGRGEWTSCAFSSARLAALLVASAVAAFAASAAVFGETNDSGGNDVSTPKMRCGAIGR